MSFYYNNQKMIHAAVNTDPLNLNMITEHKESHYGLKQRKISHIKINDTQELKVWYDFGEKIGEGSFGTVTAVKEKTTNKNWAMKTVSKSAGELLKLVERELLVLKLVSHPHIIYLDKIFESSKKLYLVFEKCHGDFSKVYEKQKPFSEMIARKIISELVDAVAYLHKYDIVHRDLKMENILLGDNPSDPNDEYYIKVTDFGLSIVKSGPGIEGMLHDYCGTLYYMAPEILTVRSYSQMCDMWAVGVILYMLVVGKYPFSANNEKDTKLLICNKQPSFNDASLSTELKNLILMLLVKDPVKRIRATEVLQHSWILNRKLSKYVERNIFEKMKEWKSEMTVETGAESDWVQYFQESDTNRASLIKQPMILPKTNIEFDRKKNNHKNISCPKSERSKTYISNQNSRKDGNYKFK